jgi:superfamily II DNA/RNA helicase
MSNKLAWTENVFKLAKDSFFHSEMAQIRAKALLKEISDQPPPYNWSYVASQVVRNMTAAVFSLETLGERAPHMLDQLEGLTLQLARTWERLAKLGERTSFETALMNAAVAYELAGYQANAVCLSRKLGRNFAEIDKPTVSELANAFMQRLFLQLLFLTERAQIEPKADGVSDTELLDAIALAMTAKAFEHASRFFLRGDGNALALGNKFFDVSERAFASQGYVIEANLVRSIRSLLPIMAQRATWTIFEKTVQENPRWKRYLKLLARGTGFNILKSHSISELWPSQILALQNGLLDLTSSKIIRMPTSAGKTRVAELAIVHTLTTIPNAKCVYIAPYRALVSELEQAFFNLFGDLGFRVTSIVGSYESDDFEQLLVAEADIWVMTPEKLDLLKRAKPEFLDNVRLFVLDEGQIVHDESRGVKFELLLSRLKRRLPNARFLFLSAVLPQETLEDFAAWFGARPEKDIITSDWRPSYQRFASFEWQGETGVIRYSPDEDIPLLKEFVPGIIKQQLFECENPKTGRITRERFPDFNSKAQIAAELAFKFAELGPVLVFCSQPNFVEAVAKALETRLGLSKKKDKNMPTFFLTGASSRSAICAKEWLGENHPTTAFLRSGIAIHHGNLPEALRKTVEIDFRNRQFQVLIATNTLAQGVNLPIRTVIVHSCWRYSKEEARPKRIPARDYWNIAGRAGRAGQETEGTIIHIIQKPRDERDYQYYLENRKEVEPVRSALFQLLQDLVDNRLSESDLSEILDPEILALLVEEGAEFFSDKNIEKVLGGTLVQTQARRGRIGTKPLNEAFVKVANEINRLLPDKSYGQVYSSTGLSSDSCEKLRTYIVQNRVAIANLLKKAGPSDVNEMASLFLESCLQISEMKPEREFGGSYIELLQLWLGGASIPQIVLEFQEQTASLEELAKFIEDLFEYRLPWGISALIGISMKELDVEVEELSKYAQYFPTMVKFGVPTPEASWALSAGIPFRETAMEIAAKYLRENRSPNREDFMQWLGKLNSEELHYEFGLEGPMLEDVNKVLSRSGPNQLLKEHASIEDILPYDTYIVGIAYENRFVIASTARVGQSVDLSRDYDNPVDRNAVKAQLSGQTLGYIDRQLAQLMAPDIDCGLRLKGTIIDIVKARIPRIKIRISKKM